MWWSIKRPILKGMFLAGFIDDDLVYDVMIDACREWGPHDENDIHNTLNNVLANKKEKIKPRWPECCLYPDAVRRIRMAEEEFKRKELEVLAMMPDEERNLYSDLLLRGHLLEAYVLLYERLSNSTPCVEDE